MPYSRLAMGAARVIEHFRRPLARRGIALDRTVVARVLSYLRPYRRRLVLVLACSAVSSLMAVVPAIVLRDFIDYLGKPHRSFTHVLGLFGIALAVMIVSAALSLLQTYLAQTMGHNALADLRTKLFDHLLGQSVAYYTRIRSGELLSRLMTDIAGLEAILGTTLPSVIANALLSVVLLVVMVVFDWQLTLAALILLPVVLLGARGHCPAHSAHSPARSRAVRHDERLPPRDARYRRDHARQGVRALPARAPTVCRDQRGAPPPSDHSRFHRPHLRGSVVHASSPGSDPVPAVRDVPRRARQNDARDAAELLDAAADAAGRGAEFRGPGDAHAARVARQLAPGVRGAR